MLSLEVVLETVRDVCKVSKQNIKSKKRFRPFSEARGLYFVFARKYTNHTIMEISNYINRHHATCVHYCKTVPELLLYDKQYRIEYGDIESRLDKKLYQNEETNADMLQQIEFQIAQLLKEKERINSATKNTQSE